MPPNAQASIHNLWLSLITIIFQRNYLLIRNLENWWLGVSQSRLANV